MPMDVCRPITNIYHNKLAIAVDWFVNIDNTNSSTVQGVSGGSSIGGGSVHSANSGSGLIGGNSVHNGAGSVEPAEVNRAAAGTPVSTAIAAGMFGV